MAYDGYSCLNFRLDQGVLFVTVDNPPINLFDLVLMQEIDRLGREIEADDDVKVVVFDSANPDFFIACNGFDIHHSERNTDLQVTSDGIYTIFKTIRELTIGKVAIVMEGGYNQTIGELTHSACAGLLGLNNPYIEKSDVLSTSALKRIKTHRIMEERLAEQKMILREFHDLS